MRRSSLRIVGLIVVPWLVLLGLSHIVRARRPPQLPAGPGVTVAAVGGGSNADSVFVAYREWRPAGQAPDALASPVDAHAPLILLHGSPGSSADFNKLLPRLARDWRTVVPDLPGFGRSTLDVPDYSIQAHARYVLAVMDELTIHDAHVVGFSMGGGVGLEMAAIAPGRVRSLTLLSSIGAIEYELLGAHPPNRAVHLVQLSAIWSLRELLPHFGLLDGAFFGVPYARNFSDTDQRRLRRILRGVEMPVAVVHGERDFLVPVAAARETARLVPQAELTVLDESHFMVLDNSAPFGEPLIDFLEQVEDGVATRRSDATPDRRSTAAAAFDPASVPPVEAVSWIVLTGLVAIVTALTVPGGGAIAGALLGLGRFGWGGAISGLLLGALLGIIARALLGAERSNERPAATGGPWWRRLGRAALPVAIAFVVVALLTTIVVALRGPFAPGSALGLSLLAAVPAAVGAARLRRQFAGSR